jgi:hypothetical protein
MIKTPWEFTSFLAGVGSLAVSDFTNDNPAKRQQRGIHGMPGGKKGSIARVR